MTQLVETWTTLASLSDSEIIEWARHQPWALEMAKCQQDPAWHAEGDVWTHTEMVCNELFKLNEWPNLSRLAQIKLLLTAIFHDAGKPATTHLDPVTQRIRSPKHAQLGARIARRVLMAMNCDTKTREEICGLILFHGRPPYLETQASPEREIIKISWYANHRMLYLFALADTRGRICNQPYSEETLNCWKLVAEENDCLDHPYPFRNDHARFLFFRNELDNLHYSPNEEFRCKMSIMAGLPGAGKDTWIDEHHGERPVVSLDQIRRQLKIAPTSNQGPVVQAARDACRVHLRDRRDFVLNATNITRQVRRLWIDIGNNYDAKIELIYLEPDLPTLLNQNRNRQASVPTAVVKKLIDKLEPPNATECHEFTFPAFPKRNS